MSVKPVLSQADLNYFREALIKWGKENYRSFPWREADTPYPLLVAEVMLHRTQATQVVPVYKRYMQTYPDLLALVSASKEELRSLLYPLGLHWRIDKMHEMATIISSNFSGQIPADKEDLLSLPGISDYIASALRCFAWNKPDALIDTNTVRITGRLFNLEVKDSSRRNRKFRYLIETLVDPYNPKAYNYALLDLANKICTKTKPPECIVCPVSKFCQYGQHKAEERTPV